MGKRQSLIPALAVMFAGFAASVFSSEITGVYFAPGADPENAMVAAINSAKESVYCQYYGFTSQPVCDALIAADKRGVEVHVLLDKCNTNQRRSTTGELISCGAKLVKAGITPKVDFKPPIAHNKVTIIDEKEVCEGSYNPTNQAKHNAENLVVINDKETAGKYLANWHKRESECETWKAGLDKAAENKRAKRGK